MQGCALCVQGLELQVQGWELWVQASGLARKAFCSGRKTGSLAYKAPGPTLGMQHV